ncbi:MAG: cobalamin-dependent protein [Deltaproteobacteria bacterium]|nr:cobalamin-dependent protein [Deltaproteobacteria bacterium]
MDFISEIVELNEENVLELLKKRLQNNEDPLNVMDDVKKSMKIIGDKFSNKEYFLPELIMSGEILRQIFEELGPRLKEVQSSEKKKGKVLLGTVAGDIHDIGKDVVKFMLDVNGFDVLDLGVDVPAEKFLESLKEYKPKVLALSGFLTLAYDSMKDIIDKLKDAGLRENLNIMIGGGTVDERIVEYVGADAYGQSAVDAVNIATKWMEE